MRRIFLIFILLLVIFSGCLPPSVFAETAHPPSAITTLDSRHWKNEPIYIDRAFGKFLNGGWNMLFGISELLTEPYEARALGKSVLVGLGKGIWNAGGDMGGGIIDMLTFPITALSMPLPEGGVAQEF